MRKIIIVYVLAAALLLSGCGMRTVEDMYSPPKRTAEYEDLQQAIDSAMIDLEYAAPLSGEYRQAVQMADLNGDGQDEYIVFARDTSENPLKIMIFTRDEKGCHLAETIAGRGSSFDLVEYVDLDGQGGVELVVGKQVSNLILRSVSVYTFPEGISKRLLSVNYSKIVPVDLTRDTVSDLMIITRGEADEDNAVAAVYSYEDGVMIRSIEAELSGSSDRIKRIMVGNLYDGIPAVYVASSKHDNSIVTDVFALRGGKFTNIAFSNESGTSVRALRNYYVYANDINGDGTPELPDLIDMVPMERSPSAYGQQMIRWYSMKSDGTEVDIMFTFHNFDDGWYLELDEEISSRISVVQADGKSIFYIWYPDFEGAEELMTIHALTGADREAAGKGKQFELCRTEGVIYTVETEDFATEYGITPELLAEQFHLIQKDWKNGET